MSTTRHPLLLAAAIAHGLLSLAHTVIAPYTDAQNISLTTVQTKGFEQFKHPTLNQLPAALKGAVKAGWYEGSVFFAIVGKIALIYAFPMQQLICPRYPQL
jgi:hypothetical protein